MILLDSSCWLEYYIDGKGAEQYAPMIEQENNIIVPTIILHEVFKVVMRSTNESSALATAGVLQQFSIIPMDENIAMYSAKLGLEYKLAMADSMILATAHVHHAEFWTQDIDFKGLPSVNYIAKG